MPHIDVCYWIDDEEPREQRKYYEMLETKTLIEIAKEGEALGHVEKIINILHEREPSTALSLAKSVLEHHKGDYVMQARMVEFMLEEGYEVSYANTFLNEKTEVRDVFNKFNN